MGLGVRAGVAMVVGTPGRNETELSGHQGDPGQCRAVEGPIEHLEATEARGLQLSDDGPTVGCLGEVGEDRQAAGRADRGDGLDRADPLARHIRWATAREEPGKAVLHARHMAFGLEQTRHGRPAERGGLGWVELGGQVVDREAQLAQSLERPSEADPALVALLGQRRFEGIVGRVDAEAEDVQPRSPRAPAARRSGN